MEQCFVFCSDSPSSGLSYPPWLSFVRTGTEACPYDKRGFAGMTNENPTPSSRVGPKGRIEGAPGGRAAPDFEDGPFDTRLRRYSG